MSPDRRLPTVILMKTLIAIAVGGAVGALARHWVVQGVGLMSGHGLPWGIVSVNLIGSFLLGCLVEAGALAWSMPQEMRALLMVGMLGGFTTFSTFALDVVLLMQRGQTMTAAGYIMISVIGAVAALYGGMAVMRAVLS